jgi:hypothetical protein
MRPFDCVTVPAILPCDLRVPEHLYLLWPMLLDMLLLLLFIPATDDAAAAAAAAPAAASVPAAAAAAAAAFKTCTHLGLSISYRLSASMQYTLCAMSREPAVYFLLSCSLALLHYFGMGTQLIDSRQQSSDG